MFSEGGKLSEEAKNVREEKLICAENGVYFLNVAHDVSGEYYELAKAIYADEESSLYGHEHELAKHRWLQNYIAAVSSEVREPYIKPLGVFLP